MRDVTNEMARLSPAEKRSLLKKLLAEKSAAEGASGFPLSYGQRALWFVQKLAPESAFFNLALTCCARPGFSPKEFSRALFRVQELHPALRTVYVERSGTPLQRVLALPSVAAQWVEATAWDESELRARVYESQLRPFGQEEPLLRVTVFRRTGEDVLLVTMHHIACDGQSLSILFEHWRRLYSAEIQGGSPCVSPPGANYKDFIEGQLYFLQQPAAAEAWHYWQRTLSGDLPVLRLAAARPRPAASVGQGRSVPLVLPLGLSERMRTTARHCRTTLYTVLLATYEVLLYRLSGQEDIVVGTPVSLRNEARWTEVIGDFINMLPLRAALRGNPTFLEYLERTRIAVLGALEHQEFPFPLIVERLRPPRHPSHAPVFQAMFNLVLPHTAELLQLFDSDATDGVTFGSSSLFPYPIRQHEGQYDLALDLTQINDVIGGKLKYDPDLLDEATVSRIAAAYISLVECLMQTPGMRIADVPIPPEIAAREEVLL